VTFADHSTGDLEQVAVALGDGRLTTPVSAVGLGRLGVSDPQGLAGRLNGLEELGFQPPQMAALLNAVITDRKAATRSAAQIELVVTGPDIRQEARDTAVVVEQLFNEARGSVLLIGFALYDGQSIFRRLAERLDGTPGMDVTLCLDISRRHTDTTRDSDLIAKYADDFRARHWSGKRLPKVYFDPRGLMMDGQARAVLHAKCIVIDRAAALVTSANPTPAAYTKNIEVGVVVRGGSIPSQIATHFEELIKAGKLKKLDLGITQSSG
jgi:hypothetical protein